MSIGMGSYNTCSGYWCLQLEFHTRSAMAVVSVSVGTPHDEEWVQLEVTVMSTVPSGSKDQGMCHDISRPDNTAH